MSILFMRQSNEVVNFGWREMDRLVVKFLCHFGLERKGNLVDKVCVTLVGEKRIIWLTVDKVCVTLVGEKRIIG
jgi:hypothetical protein